jgi:uncharacterized protein
MAAETFVFCTLTDPEWAQVGKLSPVMTVREDEGLTVVVNEATAVSSGLAAGPPMRMITLTVYSDLEAVGLTAAFAEALTSAGVSANVVAGYHHDHIFVPRHDADKAMSALITLQRAAAVGVAG